MPSREVLFEQWLAIQVKRCAETLKKKVKLLYGQWCVLHSLIRLLFCWFSTRYLLLSGILLQFLKCWSLILLLSSVLDYITSSNHFTSTRIILYINMIANSYFLIRFSFFGTSVFHDFDLQFCFFDYLLCVCWSNIFRAQAMTLLTGPMARDCGNYPEKNMIHYGSKEEVIVTLRLSLNT